MTTRLSIGDQLRTAILGPLSRPARTILSALGIAVGTAALAALTGVAASSQAQLIAELDSLGANLVVIEPGSGPDSQPVPLPDSAPAMIARVDGVAEVGVVESTPPGTHAYRNDLVPVGQTNGITVLAAGPGLAGAVGATVTEGEWFDQVTRALPTAILGASAAKRLGIDSVGDRVWVGGQWYTVIGILGSAGLANKIDTAVFLGDEWVRAHVGAEDAEPIASIYVRADTGRVEEVRSAVQCAANPGSPYVDVSQLSDLVGARDSAMNALSGLALGLAAISLLVGGIGIANTMVVAVMERRGEIGLRRALGARPGQIALQFISEAAVLGGVGGFAGSLLGGLVVIGYALATGSPAVIPPLALVAGPLVAIAVGVFAGLYPALSAARLSPTVALRST